MSNEILLESIIDSLIVNSEDWTFSTYTAENKKSNIELWISGFRLFNLHVYSPTKVNFNIFQRWRLLKALNYAIAKNLSKKL